MHQQSEPDSGFFAIKISEAFEFRPDWYRNGAVAERMLEYYWLLRSVLRERPEARRCLCRCRHCRIFFIADLRNAGRQDLGCPFGCQEAHRKCESTRHSVAYYQEPEGKIKKRLLNGKRSSGTEPCVARQEPESELDPDPDPEAFAEQMVANEAALEHCQHCGWSEALLEHVRVVCVLIEGRWLGRQEVALMPGKVLRQHSMAQSRTLDHVVAQLHHDEVMGILNLLRPSNTKAMNILEQARFIDERKTPQTASPSSKHSLQRIVLSLRYAMLLRSSSTQKGRTECPWSRAAA